MAQSLNCLEMLMRARLLIDLLFHFLSAHAFLRAHRPSAFGAMVIGVMEKQRVHHFFNRRLATRTGIAVSIGKFEFAVAAHDLMLFLGCHRPATVAAADEAGEGKFMMRLWAWISFAAKQRLHPVIFRLGDHRLMFPLIPLAAPVGIFKPAVIERFGENLVNGASASGLPPILPRWPCAKSPFRVGDFQNSVAGCRGRSASSPTCAG